jgi:MAF protein
LGLLGWDFQIVPADVDERVLPGEVPTAYVLRLAQAKARATAALVSDSALILSADTTVVDGTEVLGKPTDAIEAEAMLRQLRGRTHQVYTAVALLNTANGQLLNDLSATDVPMRSYSDAEIEAYIASGDPLDKAGAYAIQHPGFHPVERLGGCYANVVGLPLCHLIRTYRKLAPEPQMDVPRICQDALRYTCPVYETILQGNGTGRACNSS